MNKKTNEKNLNRLLQVLEEWKREDYKSRFHEILDSFEDFLILRPEIPDSWKERYGEAPEKFDYYQIVLPDDFQDPYEDDLGNIKRLRAEFENTNPPIALEHFLISRNYFIYENKHASPILAPRPILMLESADIEDAKIDYDCCISVFADGSYFSYNLDNDDEEVLGDNISDILEDKMDLLSSLSLTIPVEGRDYGFLKSEP